MSDNNPEDWTSLDYDAMWQIRRQARRNALRKKPNRKSFEKYWDDYESELGSLGYGNIKRDPNKPSVLSESYGPTSEQEAQAARDALRGMYREEEDEGPNYSTMSIYNLAGHIGIDPQEFKPTPPPMSTDHASTRVASMEFRVNNSGRQTMEFLARQGLSGENNADSIMGDIFVTWVNGKTPWKYNNRNLVEFRDFRDSASKGQYLNSNLRSDHGPTGEI